MNAAKQTTRPASKTKKAYRELLNVQHANTNAHSNGRFRQVSRGYGDYLYNQDREMFNNEYSKWIAE